MRAAADHGRRRGRPLRALPADAGLGHDYAVVNVLGQGEHGTVYLAEQQPSGTLVALKILTRDAAADILPRLQRQAPMLSALAHPNAARTLDIAASGDPGPYVATEYVRGSPITRYCERLQVPRAVRQQLIAAVAALLRCAHEIGVVPVASSHRTSWPSDRRDPRPSK